MSSLSFVVFFLFLNSCQVLARLKSRPRAKGKADLG